MYNVFLSHLQKKTLFDSAVTNKSFDFHAIDCWDGQSYVDLWLESTLFHKNLAVLTSELHSSKSLLELFLNFQLKSKSFSFMWKYTLKQ